MVAALICKQLVWLELGILKKNLTVNTPIIVEGVRTRRANRVPHPVNVPKISSGTKEHMERRGERIGMAQHHPKVNADTTQIRPQSSDLYEEYRAYLPGQFKAREREKENRT